jgi:hypothetical protein
MSLDLLVLHDCIECVYIPLLDRRTSTPITRTHSNPNITRTTTPLSTSIIKRRKKGELTVNVGGGTRNSSISPANAGKHVMSFTSRSRVALDWFAVLLPMCGWTLSHIHSTESLSCNHFMKATPKLTPLHHVLPTPRSDQSGDIKRCEGRVRRSRVFE